MLCHWPASQSVSQSIIGPAAGLQVLGRSRPGTGRASVSPAARRPPGADAGVPVACAGDARRALRHRPLVRRSVSQSVHHRPLVAAESGRSRRRDVNLKWPLRRDISFHRWHIMLDAFPLARQSVCQSIIDPGRRWRSR